MVISDFMVLSAFVHWAAKTLVFGGALIYTAAHGSEGGRVGRWGSNENVCKGTNKHYWAYIM